MPTHEDSPLAEIAKSCELVLKNRGFFLQKWTCAGCGRRITAQNVNVLVHEGHCLECNHVTNLDQRGCNFALIQSSRDDLTVRDLEIMLGLAEPGIH